MEHEAVTQRSQPGRSGTVLGSLRDTLLEIPRAPKFLLSRLFSPVSVVALLLAITITKLTGWMNIMLLYAMSM